MSTEPRYRSPQPNQRLRVSAMLRAAAWIPGPPFGLNGGLRHNSRLTACGRDCEFASAPSS
jgi:hypothetical protein